jgi:hypothetical protein
LLKWGSLFKDKSLLKRKSLRKRESLFKDKSLLKRSIPSPMDHLNGHVDPTRKDLREQISLCNPMGPCAVQQIIPSILKSEDGSVMAPCGFSMLLVSAIAAVVPCAASVKKTPPPRSNRDG